MEVWDWYNSSMTPRFLSQIKLAEKCEKGSIRPNNDSKYLLTIYYARLYSQLFLLCHLILKMNLNVFHMTGSIMY